jgi:hypothetical protein
VANVATYLAEHTDKHVLGMMSASVGVSGGLGFLCSSTIVLIMHLSLDDDQVRARLLRPRVYFVLLECRGVYPPLPQIDGCMIDSAWASLLKPHVHVRAMEYFWVHPHKGRKERCRRYFVSSAACDAPQAAGAMR